MKSSVVLISNLAARSASREMVAQTVAMLGAHGRSVDVRETSGPGDATTLARAAAAEHADFVIAAGGDGTVNEVINGLVGSEVPMALLPLGTTNVLARELGLPSAVDELVGRMLSSEPRSVSLLA